MLPAEEAGPQLVERAKPEGLCLMGPPGEPSTTWAGGDAGFSRDATRPPGPAYDSTAPTVDNKRSAELIQNHLTSTTATQRSPRSTALWS